ncbi:TIGR03986 family CRISPR-associated RAMP protein [Dickeya oryzae]|uniref:TIGR03986 family type III CRISPR-associated RAMP protein n=1 Tax=Dickeya oryzae TaxID=1240404 RepID=UPI002096E01D|nr:TIGR03986 family CRISPR-associated RAMP protein [Dickeya oryzae]MCO7255747.1 TIGR03986 family CRISPR-associated RAMP protein [Dickeya oryzae]
MTMSSSLPHTPYHFVPLSPWVFQPEWAHLVSHDYPFQDGLDGYIDYTLTNLTALLVGGEQDNRDASAITQVHWACDPQGNPLIPGSSLKGMLRNVLEIASFARFSAIDDTRFSYRDFHRSDDKQTPGKSLARAAWLKFDDSCRQWTLRRCEYAILLGSELEAYRGADKNHAITNEARQSAAEKYGHWPLTSRPIRFTLKDKEMEGTKGREVTIKNCACDLGNGDYQGYPVFTGFRPGATRYRANRLNFNYLFYGEEKQDATPVDNQKVQQLFAHHDQDLVNYLKHHPHPALGIPVFLYQNAQGESVLGFSKMPRVAYRHSIADIARRQQPMLASETMFDLPDLLFGKLSESGFSLKSRVMFSDARYQGNARPQTDNPKNTVILASPKASYINAYLEQPGNGSLRDYNNSASQLAGWKRYPTQEKFSARLPTGLQDKTSLQSNLSLLAPEQCFNGRIVFHNLKPQELGALLWVLRPNDDFRHSLGHGRSLGAGAVQLRTELTLVRQRGTTWPNDNGQGLREAFTTMMEKACQLHLKAGWQQSTQIRHLLAFGNRQETKDKNLNTMTLNEYTQSKQTPLPTWFSPHLPSDRPAQPPVFNVKGRLVELLELLEHADETPLSAEEKATLKQAHEAKWSQPYRRFQAINQQLQPYFNKNTSDANNQRTGAGPEIERLLQDALTDRHFRQQEWDEIYPFLLAANKSNFFNPAQLPATSEKKARLRYQKRQALIDDLMARFTAEKKP